MRLSEQREKNILRQGEVKMEEVGLTSGENSWQTWLNVFFGSFAVALVGVLPLLFVPNEQNQSTFLSLVSL